MKRAKLAGCFPDALIEVRIKSEMMQRKQASFGLLARTEI
jgi:hypothetical protein